jgi:hypothetical protein
MFPDFAGFSDPKNPKTQTEQAEMLTWHRFMHAKKISARTVTTNTVYVRGNCACTNFPRPPPTAIRFISLPRANLRYTDTYVPAITKRSYSEQSLTLRGESMLGKEQGSSWELTNKTKYG